MTTKKFVGKSGKFMTSADFERVNRSGRKTPIKTRADLEAMYADPAYDAFWV